MSVQVIHDFFPDSVRHMNQFVPWLLPRLFPDHLQKQCPKHVLDWQFSPELSVTVQWPWLIPAALVGVSVGIFGFLRSKRERKTWSHGCLFFALMNISAIVCHCLAPAYTQLWNVFAFADIVCTSVAATAFGLSALLTLPWFKKTAGFWTHSKLWLCTAVLICTATSMKLMEVPHTNEFFYLYVTVWAAVTTFYSLVPMEFMYPGPGRLWLVIAVLGAAAAAVSVVVDRFLCVAFGSSFTYMMLLFWGCDIAVLGLDFYFAARDAHKSASKQD